MTSQKGTQTSLDMLPEAVGTSWDDQSMIRHTRSEKTVFTFHGEAVEDGTIDLGQYANALLGYSQMVKATVSVVAPQAKETDLRVIAVSKGSLVTEVTMGVDLTVLETLREWVLGRDGVAVERALGITTLAAASLGAAMNDALKAGKWLKGRRIKKREKVDDQRSRVTTDDGSMKVINNGTLNIYYNPLFREGVRNFSSPTTLPGIDSVTLGRDQEESLTASERHWFAEPDEEIDERTTEDLRLRVERIAFDGAQWRFSHNPPPGQGIAYSFSAHIKDEEFLDDVAARHIVFGDGDEIDALVETIIPVRRRQRTRRRYTVLKVNSIHHRKDPADLFKDAGADFSS